MVRFLLLTALLLFLSCCSLSTRAEIPLEKKITGISGELLKNVVNRLTIEQSLYPKPLSPEDAQQIAKSTPDDIKKALEPFGYFKPVITQEAGRYHVTPGPQMRINRLDFKIAGEGANNPVFQTLLANFPLKQNQPLLSAQYTAAKNRLLDLAEQQGFLTPKFTEHRILVDRKRYTATVILHFDTGPRYYFGDIQFQKNPLNPDFLKHYAPFHKGEPYSSERLLKFQNSLSQSAYFEQVSVQRATSTTEQEKTHEIPIQVNLTPRKSRQYSIGAGYGTDTGIRGSLGIDWPHINQWGHRFSGLFRVSEVQNSLQTVYVIPGANPLTEQYSITASLLKTLYPQGDSITERLGVTKFNKKGFWEQSIALTAQKERYRLTPDPYRHSSLLIPSISWQYLNTDDPIYPSHAHRFNLTLQGTSRALLSNINMLQTKIEHKYITRPTSDGRVLLRGALGYTWIKDPTQLPFSQSFFAGGTQSVRGYTYQSLGPGRYMVTGSVEYQHRIKGNWNAAAFYDVGNAFNTFSDKILKHGVGIGVVWVSPVGPINVSVAKALSQPGQPLHLQFSMGADL